MSGAAKRAAGGERSWVEVIKKMDEVYRELLDYEVALERNNAALQESEAFILSVLSSISDVLIVCDTSGRIEELNPSLLKLTGRSETELRGSSILKLFADVHSRERMEIQLAEPAAGPLADCELQLCAAEGQSIPVAISCTPRLASDGRRLGLVVTGRPVGELRRAYSALSRAHEELKSAQQQLLHSEKMASLGRLVAGVAHELNNPISFVLGNVLALRKYLDKIGRYLEAVERVPQPEALLGLREQLGIERVLTDLPSLIDGTIEGAERTRDVVEGLRRFSAPGGDPQQPLDLVPVIERGVHWVRKAAREQFEVELDLPASLPVTGSAAQLQQVIMNLVQNAADATAAGNPHASRSAVDMQEAGWSSNLPTTDPAYPRRTCRSSSIRSLPPSRSARAWGSVCRSATALFCVTAVR